MKRLALAIACVAGCALASTATADEYDDAIAIVNRGDVAGGLPLLRALADRGDARAPNAIGILYQRGRGVPQDDAEAVRWYRISAERGFRWAQDNLGVMYRDGRGVAKDPAEAVRWFREAALQQLPDAQNNLGAMYSRGEGVEKDEAEAVRWYRRAAEQGLAIAQRNLGRIYRDGLGIPKSEAEAAYWFRKAADKDDAAAQVALGILYRDGRGVARDDAEAVRLFRKAADSGSSDAQANLAYMYEVGRGVAQDDAEAVRWYWNAGTQGNVVAQTRLGLMYRDGRGTARNPQAAEEWLSKAAANGDQRAQDALAALQREGRRAANARAVEGSIKAAEASVPAPAVADAGRAALAREIVEVSKLRQRFERLTADTQAADAYKAGPPGTEGLRGALLAGFTAAFVPDMMVPRVEANLAADHDAETLRAGLEWERSPTGSRITALDLQSDAPARVAARRELSRQYASKGSVVEGDRARACAQVDTLSDLTDSMLPLFESTVAAGVLAGAELAGKEDGADAAQRAVAMLRPTIREATRRMTLVYCLSEYRELGDAEFETWLAFLRSPAGGRYARGMNAAMKKAVLDRSAVLWQVVIEAARRQRREKQAS